MSDSETEQYDSDLSENHSDSEIDDGNDLNLGDVVASEGHCISDNSSNKYEKQFTKDVEFLIESGIVFIPQVNSRMMNLTVLYNISHMSQDYLSILGLDNNKCISLCLNFNAGYLTSLETPTITITDAGSIQWQLMNCLKQFIYNNLQGYIDKYNSNKYHHSDSYITNLIKHFIERVNNPGYYCVNCDKKLKYQGLKPVSCGNALCYYQFTELGLSCYQKNATGSTTSGLLNEFKFYPAICKILCYFAYACLTSHRCSKIFEEMPEHILNQFNGDRDKAFSKMKKILETLPDMDSLSLLDTESELKLTLNATDDDAYYLVRWILLTCRAHLEVVDPADKEFVEDINIAGKKAANGYQMSSSYNIKAVFKYISNPPEREQAFCSISKSPNVTKHNGFHGSPIENWHSILRKSLINCSGTDKQLHGAAYGNGIYLAPDFGTSYGYARTNDVVWKPGNLENIRCMVYCEILDDGSSGFKGANPYYVISNENLVRTKYLIAF
uniref:PARP catalytic domain-containing protein n=1 Tax=viral metagenome TaxID=1070528 RepID=A0A6C0E9J0_9ZZZZ